MENLRLLGLLEDVLGKSRAAAKNNYAFVCPFANCKKDKKKLEVHLGDAPNGVNKWHCWRCGRKGHYLVDLFENMRAPKHRIDELKTLIKNLPKRFYTKTYDSKTYVKLPDEYLPLWKTRNTPEYKNALFYLTKKRKLTIQDIFKYQIGYCETGKYKNTVIIPNYNEDGELNFFTSRSFYEGSYMRYNNIDASKDIIGFEMYINWDLPIIIVEGVFDAISIRRNAIPLYGKILLDKLKLKIIEKKVKKIYISLDRDAMKNALDITKYFLDNGIHVYFVNLTDKDPSLIGFEEITKILKSTPPITFKDLVKFRMETRRNGSKRNSGRFRSGRYDSSHSGRSH